MSSRSPHPDSLAPLLGERLRARRTDLGKTLSEVAQAADISVSYLSSVETGGSTSSLPVLVRIARALDLAIADLVATKTPTAPHRSTLQTDSPRTQLVSDDDLELRIAFHTADPQEQGMCPIPEPGRAVFAYVYSGTLVVTVDDDEWTLHQGDSIHSEAPTSVAWRTRDARTTSVWASGPRP